MVCWCIVVVKNSRLSDPADEVTLGYVEGRVGLKLEGETMGETREY